MTYYTIYKITNKNNGKYYIGKHKTKDLNDDYMGSGKLLKRAIKKYGKESFVKEILYIFETEEEANQKEKELVVVSEDTYNLCEGGKGGFSYINANNLANTKKGRRMCDEIIYSKYNVKYPGQTARSREVASERMKRLHKIGVVKPCDWTGKTHKEESKRKIGEANKRFVGIKNSQYGTCWISNGQENKKIKKDDLDTWLKLGYKQGRKIQED